jgi:hypothetical protein
MIESASSMEMERGGPTVPPPLATTGAGAVLNAASADQAVNVPSCSARTRQR